MDIRKNYRYYVVTFLDPPYSDIDQYVCIPDSWIQLREIVDQVVVAKFPVENSSITNKRVKEGEVFSDDWSIYVAEVKYGTDSYGQAEQYIKTLKKKLINGQSCSGPVNKGNGLSKISESLRRSMRKQSRVNKSQVSETSSNNNMEPLPEQLAVEIETHNKETNGVETINSANEVTNQTDASSKSLNGEQLLSNWENNPDDATVTQENNNDKSNNVDYIDNSNNPDGIAENESSANDDGPFTNESLDPIIISEPISDTGNSDRVKNTSDLNFEESCLSLFDHASDTFFQNCTSMEKLMDIINNYYDIGSYDPIITKIKDTVTPVAEETEREEKECEEKEIEKNRPVAKRTQAEIGIIKRREAERNEQENNDDDDDDDDDYVKRKRFQSRTLILPPEYDKNDSKWTLRYREYAPGLVELIEHTGVYVNAIKLINCKRLAKNSKTLARLLLVEIFTESALFTCSLTGVRAKAFDFDGTHIRPGLDENARTVLLTYVEQHAQANKWAKRDNATILNSIRNKMQEIRSKYNK